MIFNKKIDTSSLFKTIEHKSKYQTKNPISNILVKNFLSNILELVKENNPKQVHEVGCGEGQILGLLYQNEINVFGSDISQKSLDIAYKESRKQGMSIEFINRSIYELDPKVDSSETVLCCEVLEHLEDPEKALKSLLSITKKNLIISVPREPIWSILNMLRGKYFSSLGNTPGHIQRWSKKKFINFVSNYSKIDTIRTPLPWTIVSCKPILK